MNKDIPLSSIKTYLLYIEVGMKGRLKGQTLKRYVDYMSTRWPEQWKAKLTVETGYATDMAKRFRKGLEYDHADHRGLVVLREIDIEKPSVLRKEGERK